MEPQIQGAQQIKLVTNLDDHLSLELLGDGSGDLHVLGLAMAEGLKNEND